MGINLPDLIVESIIRDGLQYLKDNPTKVDEIFAPLLSTYASNKYGATEITKIKAMLDQKNIAVVHSFHLAAAKSPCYSIQLGAEAEAKERAHLGDFEAQVEVPLDPSTIIRVPNFVPTSYDPVTGKIAVADGVDLTLAHAGFKFVDTDGLKFEIKRGMSNITGSKYFFIAKYQTPNITGNCRIDSFLSYNTHEERGDTSGVSLLIGVHAKDALLTKYLYVILKSLRSMRPQSTPRMSKTSFRYNWSMKESRKSSRNVKRTVEEKLSQEITLDAFFHKSVAEGKLKPWQRAEIEAFFKDSNLRNKEDLEVYESTLKKY
jgi:hypothetical protein